MDHSFSNKRNIPKTNPFVTPESFKKTTKKLATNSNAPSDVNGAKNNKDGKDIYDVVEDLRELHLWKLTRPKQNTISFMLCKNCKEHIYNDDNKFFVPPSNKFVDIHLRLCKRCVINGIRAADYWYWNVGPGKAKKTEEGEKKENYIQHRKKERSTTPTTTSFVITAEKSKAKPSIPAKEAASLAPKKRKCPVPMFDDDLDLVIVSDDDDEME